MFYHAFFVACSAVTPMAIIDRVDGLSFFRCRAWTFDAKINGSAGSAAEFACSQATASAGFGCT